MSKKLYVGNLPFSVTSEKLKEIFSAYDSTEEAQVISFKNSGKSKGFGFVTLTNDEQADKAKQELNGKEVEGRKLFVNEAKPFDPDAPRKPRRGFGDRESGGRGRFDRRRDDSEEGQSEDDDDELEDKTE